MSTSGLAPVLRVAIVGCGLIGRTRADALGSDELVGCYDMVPESSERLASDHACRSFPSLADLLSSGPDVVIVATIHSELVPWH